MNLFLHYLPFSNHFHPFSCLQNNICTFIEKNIHTEKKKAKLYRIRTSVPVGHRFHKTPLRYYFLPIHTISSLLSSPTIIQNMPSLPILTYQKQLEIHMTFRTVHATAFTSINLFSLNIFTFLFRYSQSVRS